jgi:predicted AAA+ superfamily ATPase
MDKLVQQFLTRIDYVDLTFKRYLWNKINWSDRLIAITGARGTGKTTLLLQHIRENLSAETDKTLYVSLDNSYFLRNELHELTDYFVKRGGKFLFIDEVHKYPGWSTEIKNIYDNYPQLKIVFTGSSSLEILKGQADLSRRAVIYKLNGMSFREFLELKHREKFRTPEFHEIMENPMPFCREVIAKVKPIRYFEEYLKTGYYPFFTEGEQTYHQRIEQTVIQIIENDLSSIENIDYMSVYHLRKLLIILAEMVPFKPNIVKLSQQVGINRETLLKYLYWLERADLLMLLGTDKYGIVRMNKPEKIYLNNSNLAYALTSGSVNTGTMRETFFYNQVKVSHKVRYSEKVDFMIDDKLYFEIGGKTKSKKQLAGLDNAYIAADNIEYPDRNILPLWMFGFLY